MAYNRPYNPDELPRFAEPEAKGGAPRPSASAPPQPFQQQQQQQQHPPRYDSKPVPPRQGLPSQQRPPPMQSQQQPPPPQQQGRLSPAHSPHANYGISTPPPMGGPRPANVARPAAVSRPPPSPAPQEGVADPTLLPLFKAVDKDETGQLSERELSAALVNGDWSAFDPHTVKMMIRMFDSDRSGTIGFDEFCGLWSFLASWRTLFDRFDEDRSGNISLPEFSKALVAFRYRLSDRFVETVFQTYDKRGEGSMSFDLFVQACISLKRMTDVFKKYDEDRDGYITLSFEDFLSEILRQLK